MGATATLQFDISDEDVALVDWMGARRAFVGTYEIEFSTGDKDGAIATIPYTVSSETTFSTLPLPD